MSGFGMTLFLIGSLGIMLRLSTYIFEDAFSLLKAQPKKFLWKLAKTIGALLVLGGLGCLVILLFIPHGGKGERLIITVTAFSALGAISKIWIDKKIEKDDREKS